MNELLGNDLRDPAGLFCNETVLFSIGHFSGCFLLDIVDLRLEPQNLIMTQVGQIIVPRILEKIAERRHVHKITDKIRFPVFRNTVNSRLRDCGEIVADEINKSLLLFDALKQFLLFVVETLQNFGTTEELNDLINACRLERDTAVLQIF